MEIWNTVSALCNMLGVNYLDIYYFSVCTLQLPYPPANSSNGLQNPYPPMNGTQNGGMNGIPMMTTSPN